MKKLRTLAGCIGLAVVVMSFTIPDDWFLFETKGCTISFPKKPGDQLQILKTAIGELKLNIYMYEVTDSVTDENMVYGLMTTEYPDSVINSDKKNILDAFFRNSIDGAVSNVHGKLLTESVIRLDGFPGRETRIDFRDGLAIIRVRFYLVKNKMYMIETITDTKKDFNKSIIRFMDSFKLIN